MSFKQIYTELTNLPSANVDEYVGEFISSKSFDYSKSDLYTYLLYNLCPVLITEYEWINNIESWNVDVKSMLSEHANCIEVFKYLEFTRSNVFSIIPDIAPSVSLVNSRNMFLNRTSTLIDIFDIAPVIHDYHKDVDCHAKIYENNINEINRKGHTSAFVSKDKFLENINRYTYGFAGKLLNKQFGNDFPYKNVTLAGGLVSLCLDTGDISNVVKSSDCDFFISSATKDENEKVLRILCDTIKKEFPNSTIYFAILSSVVYCYITDIERVFQIMSTNYINGQEVLERFDSPHVKVGIDDGRIVGTPSALITLLTKVSRYNINSSKTHNVDRMIKAMQRGYNVVVSENNNITSLLKDKYKVNNILMEFEATYFPKSSNSDRFIRSNISKFSKDSKLIFTETNDVIKNIVLFQSFDTGYAIIHYGDFNEKTVSNVSITNKCIPLSTKLGHIVLRTGDVTCNIVENDDEKTTVYIKNDDLSAWYVHLRDEIYPKYCGNKKIIIKQEDELKGVPFVYTKAYRDTININSLRKLLESLSSGEKVSLSFGITFSNISWKKEHFVRLDIKNAVRHENSIKNVTPVVEDVVHKFETCTLD